MATTHIKPYKVARGRSAIDTMRDRFEYGLSLAKCAAVCSYHCEPETAHAEFLLTRNKYEAITGRNAEKGQLFFQIRQAFLPGEVTVEEAQRIGYETAMRWTKGKHQFFVCTHNDKKHLHNHIYCNSIAEDCTRKFRHFYWSSFAIRRLSDRICLEHNLSVVLNPQQSSAGKFKHYGAWLGPDKPQSFQSRLKSAVGAALAEKPADINAFVAILKREGFEHKWGHCGTLSFRSGEQKRFTRLRASTLGDGYGLDDILDAIAGRTSHRGSVVKRVQRKVNLIVDIQQKLRDGKGLAYARWASVFNLKQMAAALQYLQENNLLEYEDLSAKAESATECFHSATNKLKATESAMKYNSNLRAAVIDYARTRPVFNEYKARKYSNKFLAEHESEIAVFREAKASIKELLNGERLPKMETLKAEWQNLVAMKKAELVEYRTSQKQMREVVIVKANIDTLLGNSECKRSRKLER